MTTDKLIRELPATLIPGDGIGPEIVKSAVDILEAPGAPFSADFTKSIIRRTNP
jgi:isocitrate dehydrogenase (NAD+)